MLGVHCQALTNGRAEFTDPESSLHIAVTASNISVNLDFEPSEHLRERSQLRIFWTFERLLKESNSKPIFRLETDEVSSEVRRVLRQTDTVEKIQTNIHKNGIFADWH